MEPILELSIQVHPLAFTWVVFFFRNPYLDLEHFFFSRFFTWAALVNIVGSSSTLIFSCCSSGSSFWFFWDLSQCHAFVIISH